MRDLIPVEVIERKIFLLRGQKIMLSIHLAVLYGVQARVLIQAVKRNIERFPEDFMFQLSDEEYANLKSQIVTSSWGGSRRANPCYPPIDGAAGETQEKNWIPRVRLNNQFGHLILYQFGGL